jgi:hypothetical protein
VGIAKSQFGNFDDTSHLQVLLRYSNRRWDDVTGSVIGKLLTWRLRYHRA